MFLNKLLLIAVINIEVFSKPQFENIEIYEVDLNQQQYQNNNNHHQQYQNNPFLSFVNSGNQNSQNQQNTVHVSPTSSCESYWSYQNNFNENWGQIVIPEPNYKKNVLRITLSLAARLLNTV